MAGPVRDCVRRAVPGRLVCERCSHTRLRRALPYLARVAFAGGVTGMAGMTMAMVMTAGATTEGAASHPVVSRAVMTASGGPFLLAAMGLAAFLLAAGLLTLRTGVFARWTGIVALIGAAGFLVAFATVLSGLGEDSPFGYGFFPGAGGLVDRYECRSIPSFGSAAKLGTR
jgi:hypothetical protein